MALIRVKEQSDIVFVELNNPEKRNALSITMMKQLCQTIQKANKRVLILHAAGPVFCAGLDLSEAANHNLIEESSQWIEELFSKLYHCPLTTIAVVNGTAVAGGGGLLAACDYVIASESTKIGFPEVHRGLVAAHVANLLSRQIQIRDIRELLLLGELVDSHKALSIGLVNCIVPEEKLMDTALAKAKQALKGAPGALKATKKLLENLTSIPYESGNNLARQTHQTVRHSSEALEGARAFQEKREPSWMRALD